MSKRWDNQRGLLAAFQWLNMGVAMSGVPKRVFMPVYNEIAYDGRVQRAADALSGAYDVTVFSVGSESTHGNPKFSIKPVGLSKLRHIRVARYAYFCFVLIITAVRARPHLIYAHDYFTALPSYIAARLMGAKLAYDAHELSLPEKEGFRSRRDAAFYWLEKVAIKRADLVIAANRERAELMREHYALAKAPLVIRNIPPMPREFLGLEETLRRYPMLRRGRTDGIRLVYQGYLSVERGVGAFIRAMHRLPDRFELVLVGGGPEGEMAAIRKEVESCGVARRVIFLGRVPREHLYDVLKSCDVGIVSYGMKTLNHYYCAPNKIFEYAQAGLPMIVTCQPPLKSLNDTYRIGVVVGCEKKGEEASITEITEGCLRIAAQYDECRARLPKFLADHRWESEARRLRQAVTAL